MAEYYITIRPGEGVNCRGYALHRLGVIKTQEPVYIDREPLEAFPLEIVQFIEEADAAAVQAQVAGRLDVVHLPVIDTEDREFVWEVPDVGLPFQRTPLTEAVELYQDMLGYTVDFVRVIPDAEVELQVHPDSPLQFIE